LSRCSPPCQLAPSCASSSSTVTGHLRTARRCCDRRSSLGRALRPRDRERLRGLGRDGPHHRSAFTSLPMLFLMQGLAREGRPAVLGTLGRRGYLADADCRAAGTWDPRPQEDRRARRPRPLRSSIRPIAWKELHRRWQGERAQGPVHGRHGSRALQPGAQGLL
jgi:hypothetical protein